MNLSLLVAQVYSLFLLAMGISLFFAPRAWAALLREFEKKSYGALMYVF